MPRWTAAPAVLQVALEVRKLQILPRLSFLIGSPEIQGYAYLDGRGRLDGCGHLDGRGRLDGEEMCTLEARTLNEKQESERDLEFS